MSSEYEQNIAKLLFEKMKKMDLLLENPQKNKYEKDNYKQIAPTKDRH